MLYSLKISLYLQIFFPVDLTLVNMEEDTHFIFLGTLSFLDL